MPLIFTVVATATVLDWRMAPRLAGAGAQADNRSWPCVDWELLRSPAETSFRPLQHRLLSTAEGMAGGVECSRSWARAATRREGFSDWSIQEDTSSKATLAVLWLGDFFPPFLPPPPPLLTLLKIFETIVDHHTIVVSLR